MNRKMITEDPLVSTGIIMVCLTLLVFFGATLVTLNYFWGLILISLLSLLALVIILMSALVRRKIFPLLLHSAVVCGVSQMSFGLGFIRYHSQGFFKLSFAFLLIAFLLGFIYSQLYKLAVRRVMEFLGIEFASLAAILYGALFFFEYLGVV